MVALDNSHYFAAPRRSSYGRVTLPGLLGLAAMTVVLGALAARGFSDNGLRLGSQLGWRFASFVFFLALVVGPVGRLFRSERLAAQSCPVLLGFCASIAVYFASVLIPALAGHRALGGGALLFVLLGGGVALVMAATTTHWLGEHIGDKARRTLLGVAAVYFWLCYALMGLSHISGPHRPDMFYGISLSLMIAALLMRFADRLVLGFRSPAFVPS